MPRRTPPSLLPLARGLALTLGQLLSVGRVVLVRTVHRVRPMLDEIGVEVGEVAELQESRAGDELLLGEYRLDVVVGVPGHCLALVAGWIR